jgi:hypothetical protein
VSWNYLWNWDRLEKLRCRRPTSRSSRRSRETRRRRRCSRPRSPRRRTVRPHSCGSTRVTERLVQVVSKMQCLYIQNYVCLDRYTKSFSLQYPWNNSTFSAVVLNRWTATHWWVCGSFFMGHRIIFNLFNHQQKYHEIIKYQSYQKTKHEKFKNVFFGGPTRF